MSQTVIENIDSVFRLLNAHGIPGCIIGEIALNYYNVPRVVHVGYCQIQPRTHLTASQDLEIAVRHNDLHRASSVLKSERQLLEPADEDTFNVYTEYRRGLPRFRFRDNNAACVVLFPDKPLSGGDLLDSIIPQWLHQQNSEYSCELLDLIPEDKITSLPLPFLGPLLSSYCQKHMASQDDIAAMAVESLVDGMDLDELWCMRNLTQIEPKGLDYVYSKVRDKSSRMDYFSSNTVTCIIANSEEKERLLKVPGREIPSLSGTVPCQSLVLQVWNITTGLYNDHWLKVVLRFFKSQTKNLPHKI